jgi:hypothetical protein
VVVRPPTTSDYWFVNRIPLWSGYIYRHPLIGM